MNIHRQLLSPFKYFAASNSAKRLIDWGVPLVLTTVVAFGSLALPSQPTFLGELGIVAKISGLMQDLAGFYIAALAAVATFHGKALDQFIAGDEPVVLKDVHGRSDRITRRRLLSLMFAYLSLMSIVLWSVGTAAEGISTSGAALMDYSWWPVAEFVLKFAYLFGFAQLIAVTMLGLHYLGDRLHRDNPEPLPPEERPRDT